MLIILFSLTSCKKETDDCEPIVITYDITTITTTSTTGKYKVVDTNQSTCYESTTGNETSCTFTGQDGEYSGNEPNYTVSIDRLTVTDNITGLMWTQSPDVNNDGLVNAYDKKTQISATAYCDSLELAGHSDWRLPDVKTLYSLIDFTGEDPSGIMTTGTSSLTPFIPSVFTPGFGDSANGERIIDGQYATTTIYAYYTNLGHGNTVTMFGVNFVDGRIKGYPVTNKTYYVHCVRGNRDYGLNNFADNQDNTISDHATGLMWQKNDAKSTDFDNAINICEIATTGGYTDWRLPNIKELHSIIDYSRAPDYTNSAAINDIFTITSIINEGGKTDYGYYWSSTTHANNAGAGKSGAYMAFGRALGYVGSTVLDVHGAGAQRSNYKMDISTTQGGNFAIGANGTFYYHGPQGDILRANNMVRCVRNID